MIILVGIVIGFVLSYGLYMLMRDDSPIIEYLQSPPQKRGLPANVYFNGAKYCFSIERKSIRYRLYFDTLDKAIEHREWFFALPKREQNATIKTNGEGTRRKSKSGKMRSKMSAMYDASRGHTEIARLQSETAHLPRNERNSILQKARWRIYNDANKQPTARVISKPSSANGAAHPD